MSIQIGHSWSPLLLAFCFVFNSGWAENFASSFEGVATAAAAAKASISTSTTPEAAAAPVVSVFFELIYDNVVTGCKGGDRLQNMFRSPLHALYLMSCFPTSSAEIAFGSSNAKRDWFCNAAFFILQYSAWITSSVFS